MLSKQAKILAGIEYLKEKATSASQFYQESEIDSGFVSRVRNGRANFGATTIDKLFKYLKNHSKIEVDLQAWLDRPHNTIEEALQDLFAAPSPALVGSENMAIRVGDVEIAKPNGLLTSNDWQAIQNFACQMNSPRGKLERLIERRLGEPFEDGVAQQSFRYGAERTLAASNRPDLIRNLYGLLVYLEDENGNLFDDLEQLIEILGGEPLPENSPNEN